MTHMAIGARLGSATVDVEANISGFGTSIIRSMRTDLPALREEANRIGKTIGKELASGIAQGFRDHAPVLSRQIKAILRAISQGAQIDVDVRINQTTMTESERTVRQSMGRLSSDSERFGQSLGGNMFGRLFSVMETVSPKFAKVMASIKTVAGKGFANSVVMASQIYLAYFAATALAGAFNATGRELLNLLKLSIALPGAIALIAAATVPVVIAFRGVADAVKAVWDKDPKKFAESVSGLSHSARQFAMSIRDNKKWFDELFKNTQERMFVQFKGVIPKLIKSIGPSIFVGFGQIASVVGMLIGDIGKGLSSSKTAKFLDSLFMTAKGIIKTLSGPLVKLFGAIRDAVGSTLPTFTTMGENVATMITNFTNWINEKTASGAFALWLQDGLTTLGELKDLAKEVGGLLGVLFDEGNQDGESFIVHITNMIRKMKEFAASPDGKLAMEGLTTAAKAAFAIFYSITWVIGVVIASLGSLIGAIQRALEWLGILDKKQGNISRTAGNSIRSGTASMSGMGLATQPKPRARGTITSGPEFSLIGEAGREVVIPLTQPDRARELARDSGLTNMLQGSGGGDSYTFYIGTEQVDARIVRIARGAMNSSVRMASYGGVSTAVA
jgi:hypothetical protein